MLHNDSNLENIYEKGSNWTRCSKEFVSTCYITKLVEIHMFLQCYTCYDGNELNYKINCVLHTYTDKFFSRCFVIPSKLLHGFALQVTLYKNNVKILYSSCYDAMYYVSYCLILQLR